MNFTRIYAIALRQWFLIRKNPTRFSQYFIWIAIDVVLWGFITKYLATVTAPGFSLTAALLGAVLLWNFLTRVMQGVATAFFEDMWSRNFLNMFGSPISLGEYTLGLVLTSFFTSMAGLLLILLIARFAFGFSLLALGLPAVAFLSVLLLFGIALGIVGVSLVLRFGPSAEWYIWPIPTILSPFVGVFYPISALPVWMQHIAWFLPPSYVFEGLRTMVSGGMFAAGEFGMSFLLALISIALAYALLTVIYRSGVKTGLLARYSAEMSS